MDAFSFYSAHSSHQLQPECSDESFSISIRVARQDDLVNLTELIAASFHDRKGAAGFFFPILRMGIYEDLRYRLKSPSANGVCLVAAISRGAGSKPYSEVAGTVELTFRSNHPFQLCPSHYPYLSNLAVCSRYRRRGIAQKLLSACELMVRERGFEDLYLHVLEDNNSARQLYFKAGYSLKQMELLWYTRLFNQPGRLLLHKQILPV